MKNNSKISAQVPCDSGISFIDENIKVLSKTMALETHLVATAITNIYDFSLFEL